MGIARKRNILYKHLMKNKLHPLQAWLNRLPLSVMAFSDLHKFPRRTIYDQVRGIKKHPTFETMQAIEKATKGAVTVQAQAAWFRARRRPIRAGDPGVG